MYDYFLMDANGEKLEQSWGNSQGETKGCYDPDDPGLRRLRNRPGGAPPEAADQEEDRAVEGNHQGMQGGHRRGQHKTYNMGGYGAISWSSRAGPAQKAANTYTSRTRRTTVSPVDQYPSPSPPSGP